MWVSLCLIRSALGKDINKNNNIFNASKMFFSMIKSNIVLFLSGTSSISSPMREGLCQPPAIERTTGSEVVVMVMIVKWKSKGFVIKCRFIGITKPMWKYRVILCNAVLLSLLHKRTCFIYEANMRHIWDKYAAFMMQISIIFSKNEVLSTTIFEYCQNIIKLLFLMFQCTVVKP